jgi:hypothetical protein
MRVAPSSACCRLRLLSVIPVMTSSCQSVVLQAVWHVAEECEFPFFASVHDSYFIYSLACGRDYLDPGDFQNYKR